jgi:hypothetical protein
MFAHRSHKEGTSCYIYYQILNIGDRSFIKKVASAKKVVVSAWQRGSAGLEEIHLLLLFFIFFDVCP